jgi:hypothetical protein
VTEGVGALTFGRQVVAVVTALEQSALSPRNVDEISRSHRP